MVAKIENVVPMRPLPSRLGMTLIELLVVIGILGILIGLSLPGIQAIRSSSTKLACQNNLKQIGLAIHAFHDRRGFFPQGPPAGTIDLNVHSPLSWRVLILPELGYPTEGMQAIDALKMEPVDPFVSPPHQGLSLVIKPYVCPADGRLFSSLTNPVGIRAAFTDYIGLRGGRGFEGVLGLSSKIRMSDILDGTTNTLICGERPPPDTLQAGIWYTWLSPEPGNGFRFGPDELIHTVSPVAVPPGDSCVGGIPNAFGPGRPANECDRYHLWSLHSGGANFLFADGSCRYLNYSVNDLLPALSTRAGGEPVSLP
ncbi:DUF1559 family PulG-like putative transporter [Tuwongella immobilis]|uniref:DUF1559 domain-containing protein n=1 Tax=Tuwongella immobilis TaxID=692036 RepID=A0A6C2YNP4_9BACT|nr:DUF1559 domain-containing protein [Tuwongella immobilis]VIP03056.1 Uncharacterized protein OS=Planctomyces limnophilus (strain ATCC 43296 / DSM 3776 / IFAM 1008 / 290) GN=Plim_3197 PE=4 SV=1: SBP_bac_10 [Tuwongella immobilis]VTS03255.1 Uncharacterized protein OS=Planctomyces limnophilus (strain ATCC 43296 / DSM 3776 / IFAM 1008 / 290) GN=Plim_3197 PE=4 SV=1: SBP_bac_10 [Tuwongella immobilis]